jgi:spermidine/putrescine transport system substrate-binding protein
LKLFRCFRYGLLALCLLLLASCGSASAPGGDPASVTLKVFNWGDYIDPDVTDLFTQETGIEVIYTMFEANEDMYTSIKASGGVSHDVVIPSDYMIRKMINEDMLRKINLENIPNYDLIDDRFKDLDFDPQNEYSVPYMWGTVGIAYNTTMVDGPIDSWTALWDERYRKNIFMMDSVRDSLGVTLKMLGYSMNTKNEAELQEAYEKLVAQKPLVLAYTGDEVKDKMIAGEAALAVVYAGDAITISDENPDIAYVIPREGSNMWVDSMCILKTAQNPEAAEAFINFMCSTPIAQRNWEYINYSSPQTEVIAQMPEEFQNNPARNPSAEELARCEVFEDLSQTTQYYEDLWTRLIGA